MSWHINKVAHMGAGEVYQLLAALQELLYLDDDDEGNFWNIDKPKRRGMLADILQLTMPLAPYQKNGGSNAPREGP